jgi:hypothetical protein
MRDGTLMMKAGKWFGRGRSGDNHKFGPASSFWTNPNNACESFAKVYDISEEGINRFREERNSYDERKTLNQNDGFVAVRMGGERDIVGRTGI